MKTTLLTFILILSLIAVNGQTTDTVVNKIFTVVEVEPSFPGGVGNFFKYLQENIKYPADAEKNRVQGKVFVGFVVEKDGSLTDVKVLRSVSPDIDAEAIRVINNSPKWEPGIQNGRTVRTQSTMSINFKLPPPIINAQQRDTITAKTIDSASTDKIFTAIDKEPSFPGGDEAFLRYMTKYVKYPDVARENNIQGKVFVSFIVEKDGSLSDIKVEKGLSRETDAEALRFMNNNPKWKPGMQNRRPVRVAYTMPIPFPVPSLN
jgi:TonB family protein